MDQQIIKELGDAACSSRCIAFNARQATLMATLEGQIAELTRE